MEIVSLIISIIALAFAILAYQKAGGIAGLKRQTEVLSRVGDSIVKATDSLREKTADFIAKMEEVIRRSKKPKEEEKPEEKPEEKQGEEQESKGD
jgi:hypothetical protein